MRSKDLAIYLKEEDNEYECNGIRSGALFIPKCPRERQNVYPIVTTGKQLSYASNDQD